MAYEAHQSACWKHWMEKLLFHKTGLHIFEEPQIYTVASTTFSTILEGEELARKQRSSMY